MITDSNLDFIAAALSPQFPSIKKKKIPPLLINYIRERNIKNIFELDTNYKPQLRIIETPLICPDQPIDLASGLKHLFDHRDLYKKLREVLKPF